MNKWQKIVLICLGVLLLATGGFLLYRKYLKKSSSAVEVGKLNPVNPVFDMLHGKTIKVTTLSGGSGSVHDADKVGMLLEIPAGALDADTELKIIPIKKKEEGAIPGIAILPEGTKFKKPVILTFDYSLSQLKNDKAPDNGIGTEERASGSSHIYRYNTVSTSFMSQLVNRSTETKRTLSAEIIFGGIYNYVLDDKFEVDRATYALGLKDQTVQTALESANTLFANNKKIEGKSADLLKNAIIRVKAEKSPDVIELYSALLAEKSLAKQKSASYVKKALAADTYSGYLETICKDPAVSIDQILSAWKTAQLAGYDGAAENCKTRVQNVVAERVNKLLDQPDPTYVELLKANQDIILVGLEDQFGDAIAKKRHDKAVREAQELLKDPSVDPRIIAIALQNMQLFVDDQPALEQALIDRMNQGLDTDVQRVLNDPNASKQDIERALAKNDFTGGNEEIKKKLEDKLKTAKDGQDAKVDETASEQVEEEMPAFDWGIIGVAFLKMMGVEDFSEAGLKAWADQQAKQFEEMKAYIMELCYFDEALSGISMGCEAKGNEIDQAIDQFRDGIDAEAEKIGAIQALPEDEVDYEYDGNNDESLSGSCISEEEADQIDPNRELGYTICPETPDDSQSNESGDQTDESIEQDAGSSDDSSNDPTDPNDNSEENSDNSENPN